jgi:hypothetical protein
MTWALADLLINLDFSLLFMSKGGKAPLICEAWMQDTSLLQNELCFEAVMMKLSDHCTNCPTARLGGMINILESFVNIQVTPVFNNKRLDDISVKRYMDQLFLSINDPERFSMLICIVNILSVHIYHHPITLFTLITILHEVAKNHCTDHLLPNLDKFIDLCYIVASLADVSFVLKLQGAITKILSDEYCGCAAKISEFSERLTRLANSKSKIQS